MFVFKVLRLKFISKVSLSKQFSGQYGREHPGGLVTTIYRSSWRERRDRRGDELYKTLSISQNLNLRLSHLKVLIQIVSIILIVLLNTREKEKPPDLIAMIMRKALWTWICCRHKVESMNSNFLLRCSGHSPTTTAHSSTSMNSGRVGSGSIRHFIISSFPHTAFKRAEERNPLEDIFLSFHSLEGILTKNHLLANQTIFPKIREGTINTFILKYSVFTHSC